MYIKTDAPSNIDYMMFKLFNVDAPVILVIVLPKLIILLRGMTLYYHKYNCAPTPISTDT